MKIGTRLGVDLVVSLAASAAGAAETPSRPNMFFVLVDDLRFDEIDYPFVALPNVQRLAREGACASGTRS